MKNNTLDKGDIDNKSIPLVVDLDGSLLKTELPWEAFLFVLAKNPKELLKIFLRKIKVKKPAYLKTELDKWATFLISEMPFSPLFIEYLKTEKAKGRSLILCTGSLKTYAQKIQNITGLFDAVYGSQLGKNLVGRKKAQFLVDKYGKCGFDYAGNSLADLKVALFARRFIQVNPSFVARVFLYFSKKLKAHDFFVDKKYPFKSVIYTLGLSWWQINAIIFLCLITGFTFSYLLNLSMLFLYFNFLAMAFQCFFNMINIFEDRNIYWSKGNHNNITSGFKDMNIKKNLFASGDLNLCFGCFFAGTFLVLTFFAIIYLTFFIPILSLKFLSFILTSVFYVYCLHQKVDFLKTFTPLNQTGFEKGEAFKALPLIKKNLKHVFLNKISTNKVLALVLGFALLIQGSWVIT